MQWITSMSETSKNNISGGIGRVTAGILGALVSRWVVNSIEARYGVSLFQEIGMTADLVKDTITGTVSGVAAGLTPRCLVRNLVDIILFWRGTCKEIDEAMHKKDVPSVLTLTDTDKEPKE